MNELPRLCPRCFVVGPEAVCGVCGGTTQAFGTRRAGPLVVGRLRLLDGPPALDDLTADWSGPRRYPPPPEGVAKALLPAGRGVGERGSKGEDPPPVVCRYRDGTMVWLWEAAWDTAFSDPEDIWVYRALGISDGLILEAPLATAPEFRASYARRRGHGSPLPELGDLLGGLEAALDYLSHGLGGIALIHPTETEAAELAVCMRRLASRSGELQRLADPRQALVWTLNTCRPRPRRPVAGDAEHRPDGRIDIGLLDLGGTLARALLTRLHGHSFEGRTGHGVRLVAADPATPSADWRHGSLRGDLSARIRPVPPWQGTFVHRWWWRRPTRVRLALAEDGGIPVRVVAVGESRLRGEQALARLLDLDYSQPLGRLLLLYREGYSDRDLLRWAERELGASSRALGGDDLDTDLDTLFYLVSHLLSGRE